MRAHYGHVLEPTFLLGSPLSNGAWCDDCDVDATDWAPFMDAVYEDKYMRDAEKLFIDENVRDGYGD